MLEVGFSYKFFYRGKLAIFPENHAGYLADKRNRSNNQQHGQTLFSIPRDRKLRLHPWYNFFVLFLDIFKFLIFFFLGIFFLCDFFFSFSIFSFHFTMKEEWAYFPPQKSVNKRARCGTSKKKLKAYLKVLFPLACRSGLQVTAVATVFTHCRAKFFSFKTQNWCNT